MTTIMFRLAASVLFLGVALHGASAQDVPGIEICTAEKTMERRTSCLQSNINFLKATITKTSLESQQKIDAANRQIEALKATVAGLQKTVEQLQAGKSQQSKDPSPKDKPKDVPAK